MVHYNMLYDLTKLVTKQFSHWLNATYYLECPKFCNLSISRHDECDPESDGPTVHFATVRTILAAGAIVHRLS
jgi:hypothetical protein